MTEQGFNELAGKKVSSLLLTLSLSKHYTTPLLQTSPPPFQNPIPISSIANLNTIKKPDSVFHRVGFARIGYTSQSLITRNPKALFKGKSKRDRAFGGESEPLPRLIQRGFEGDQTTLPIASEIGVEIPLKASCSDGLRVMDTNQGVEKRKPQECSVNQGLKDKGWRKTMIMSMYYKGLGGNSRFANLLIRVKMQY